MYIATYVFSFYYFVFQGNTDGQPQQLSITKPKDSQKSASNDETRMVESPTPTKSLPKPTKVCHFKYIV